MTSRISRGTAPMIRRSVFLLLLGATVMPSVQADSTVDLTFSLGRNSSTDSTFWGGGLDFSRYLSERWSWTSGIAFDQDLLDNDAGITEKTHTFGVGATINYDFNDQWALSMGASKAIIDDAGSDRAYAFTDGDWGVGFSLAYGRAWKSTRSWSAGISYEYNLDQHEHTVSLDLGISLNI